MKKIEANTLEEAYEIACREFDCSFMELKYEIIQYPVKGLLGIFSKKAIIVADRKEEKKEKIKDKDIKNQDIVADNSNIVEEDIKESHKNIENIEDIDDEKEEILEETKVTVEEKRDNNITSDENEIIDNFFSQESKTQTPSNIVAKDNQKLAKEIESNLKRLIDSTCFDIDTIEVDVEDNTALIFIDGEDAALLIGKEGYRYNALSYLLFNWIYPKYGLYIKLEIARFLQTQSEMIRNYIQPVVEHVERNGWGKTRPLDGILAQIALEQLRDRFPNKYVAIKKSRDDDKRYVIINDFIKSY